MLRQHPIVTVDLAVAQIRHQRPLKAPDFSLLLKLPWPQLVLGIFQYVLETEGGEMDVWYGMVWYGMVRKVWFGMVW